MELGADIITEKPMTTDEKKIQFPDGALVYVVGEDVSKFEARVVLIDGEKPQLIVSSGDFSEAAESSTPD